MSTENTNPIENDLFKEKSSYFNKTLFFLTLLFCFFSENIYLINEKLTLARIFGTLFCVTFILGHIKNNATIRISIVEYKIIKIYLLFCLYIFFNDAIIDKVSVLETTYEFLKHLLPITLFFVMIKSDISTSLILKRLLFLSTIPLFFGLIQIINPHFTLENLIFNKIPFINAPAFSDFLIINYNRLTGSYETPIGFSFYLGIFFILGFSFFLKSRKLLYFPYFLIIIILIFTTQTRSAIYGLPATIFFTFLIHKKINKSKIFSFLLIAFIIFQSFNALERQITKFSSRAKFEIEGSTYIKLTSNIYGSYAVLLKHPLFGIAYSDQYEYISYGARALSYFIKNSDGETQELEVTNHNLFGYYLKMYGLIGLYFLCHLLFLIFKRIKSIEDKNVKFFVFGSLIYYLQFSLLHNTNLLYLTSIWIILATGPKPLPATLNKNKMRLTSCNTQV